MLNRAAPYAVKLTHIEGSLGFVYDRLENRLHIRFMARNERIVALTAPSDNSTERSRRCRARKRAAKLAAQGTP